MFQLALMSASDRCRCRKQVAAKGAGPGKGVRRLGERPQVQKVRDAELTGNRCFQMSMAKAWDDAKTGLKQRRECAQRMAVGSGSTVQTWLRLEHFQVRSDLESAKREGQGSSAVGRQINVSA